MPNRQNRPNFITSDKIQIKDIEKTITADNISLYILNSGDQDIIKLDFVFEAGRIYHNNPIIPEIANDLIDKGTRLLTSEEISEKFDFYGAYLETEIGKHKATITLYTLNKYYKETSRLLFEIIFEASFLQNEIDIFLNNKYQNFRINRLKTDVVSSELFVKTIYGNNHPYGNIVDENNFKNINREDVLNFYSNYYTTQNMFVMLSGKVNNKQISCLKSFLEELKTPKTVFKENSFSVPTINNSKIYHKIENTIQSSIRVGKLTINKLHPDYFKLNIASVILGGYFGSRLMMNIREDKGYTYGIYSGNMSLLKSGYFLISAESGKDVYKKALEEIYKELKILRTVPVGKDELNRVKRWLFGNILKIFDGPLVLSETYKSIIPYNLSSVYFQNYFEAIKKILPEDIMYVAGKYLHEDSMTEVIAGA